MQVILILQSFIKIQAPFYIDARRIQGLCLATIYVSSIVVVVAGIRKASLRNSELTQQEYVRTCCDPQAMCCGIAATPQ